jgi:hypothetical protein
VPARLAVRPGRAPRGGWRLEIGGRPACFDHFVTVRPGPSEVTLHGPVTVPGAAGHLEIRFVVYVRPGRATTVGLALT